MIWRRATETKPVRTSGSDYASRSSRLTPANPSDGKRGELAFEGWRHSEHHRIFDRDQIEQEGILADPANHLYVAEGRRDFRRGQRPMGDTQGARLDSRGR